LESELTKLCNYGSHGCEMRGAIDLKVKNMHIAPTLSSSLLATSQRIGFRKVGDYSIASSSRPPLSLALTILIPYPTLLGRMMIDWAGAQHWQLAMHISIRRLLLVGCPIWSLEVHSTSVLYPYRGTILHFTTIKGYRTPRHFYILQAVDVFHRRGIKCTSIVHHSIDVYP
jgi:hypothetical protein